MGLSEVLDEYDKAIATCLDRSKKQAAAVQKLQKAIETGEEAEDEE